MNDRLLLAGTHSGCGKTTVTCALLGALHRRGLALQSYKCGPDYIDPMFHRRVLGISAENLDPFFSTPEQLRLHLGQSTYQCSIIEGVMGYYDGIGPQGDASTYHVAHATDTPVVLVVNAKGAFTSLGATIQGFTHFRPESHIQGVIFNGCSPMLYPQLQQVAEAAGVQPYGFLPHTPEATIGSRHLGLITADEIDDIRRRLDALADLAEKYLDIDGLLALAATASPLPMCGKLLSVTQGTVIAVARDEAFCFLYEENLNTLRHLGCELAFFSPLHDAHLPANAQGLYLPGGYPELHAATLSENPIRHEIAAAIRSGMPTIAECGGFLYLHRALDGAPMAGVLDTEAHTTDKLQAFGYVTLRCEKDNMLCSAGDTVPAHEFHYCASTDNGNTFTAIKPSGNRSWPCVHSSDTLYAGYPHLYFPSCVDMVSRFVRKAAAYAL